MRILVQRDPCRPLRSRFSTNANLIRNSNVRSHNGLQRLMEEKSKIIPFQYKHEPSWKANTWIINQGEIYIPNFLVSSRLKLNMIKMWALEGRGFTLKFQRIKTIIIYTKIRIIHHREICVWLFILNSFGAKSSQNEGLRGSLFLF